MKAKTHLIGLKLAGKRCLVVGNDEEAAARAETLASVGAHVTLISGAPSPGLLSCSRPPNVELVVRELDVRDLDGIFLAVLTDRDEHLARKMQSAAEAHNALFCAIDLPAYGNFSHVAIAKAGSLSLGISTDGRAPALARRLREELERVLTESNVESLVQKLDDLRKRTASSDRRDVLARAVEAVRLTGKLEWKNDDE